MVAQNDISKPSWKLRRRAVFGTLVFAAFIILYVAIRWDDTSLASTLVLSMAGLMGSIVAAYTGFAVWEDRGLHNSYQENAMPTGHYGPQTPPAPHPDQHNNHPDQYNNMEASEHYVDQ